MARTATKKVRLTLRQARTLRSIARERGVTESDVLREGLDLIERVRGRQRNIEGLSALIEGEEPEKIRFRLGG